MLPDFHNAGYIHEPQDSAQLFHFYDARTKLIRFDFYENNSSDISRKKNFYNTRTEPSKTQLWLNKYGEATKKVTLNMITFRPLNVPSYKK